MAFKINISEKTGKTYKIEAEANSLMGMELHSKVQGSDISPELHGYEFEITGTSDKAGFPALENVDGVGLKRVLLTYGKGMHKRSKREGKKHRTNFTPKGLRLRKTVRGKIISENIVQINLKVLKEGAKKLAEIFSGQGNKESKVKRSERRKGKTKKE